MISSQFDQLNNRPSFVCKVAKGGDEFVGLKYEDGTLQIHFPMGYKLATTSDDNYNKICRKNILNLISVLSSFGTNEKKEGFYHHEASNIKDEYTFPIHSYLHIVAEFLNHGYYTETDIIYKKANSGKINWSRTIKHIKPYISEKGFFYPEFITRKTNHDESELITQIHQWCVYESFVKIGFLFCSYMPQKPSLGFNSKLFKSIILSKMVESFNERTLTLMQHILNIIDYKDKNRESKIDCFGTGSFHIIWEKMIDNIFGTETNKTDFFPHGVWKLQGRNPFDDSPLIPDSIMKYKDRIFVIDSKYYQYGITGSKNDLPPTSSILKQIAYAEFIENSEKHPYDGSQIFNAFVMPFNAQNGESPVIKHFGIAESNWKKPCVAKPYLRIHGILLDTHWVMENCSTNNDYAIKALVDKIDGIKD